MSSKKSFPFTYKRLLKRYKDYKLEYQIKGHERDIVSLNREIEVHKEILLMLRKKEKNEQKKEH